ncbi:MAG: FtsX-like permease family protein [Planctomycetes bacterium]|nr:FtsX-like permease family protein [Planctomycetota bacterium]
MYKLFLTLRYLYKRRIAYFAIAAVMLCTAMVLIVMSVMGGFLDNLKSKARGLLGDIIVDNQSYSGFPLYQEFIDEISAWPEIVKAAPVLYSYGIIRFRETMQTGTVRIVGLRLKDVYDVNAFKQSLYYEQHYPGSTNLGEQQKPVLGVLATPGGDPVPRLSLPEPLARALAQSRAAGIPDEDSAETELNVILREEGLPPIPGIYDFNDEARTPGYVGEPYPGVIIGRDIIAKRLPDGRYERFPGYPRGCLLTLTLVPITDAATFETPVKQQFRYVDDSRTGIYEIDSQHVYCDFSLLQKLLLMDEAERVDETGRTIGTVPARCSQIQVKIADGVAPRAIAQRLREHYRAFLADPRFKLDPGERRLIERITVLTWEQSQAHIIAPVEKERQLVTILFGIISLVAVALILCILYMIVLQKTRDIGIIKSIGGSSAGVACVFLIYGAAVGIVGSALGTVAGYYFVVYINEIQDFLVYVNPAWQVWDRSVYSFDEIPSTVRSFDMVVVIVFAVIASTLGAFAAAWRAGGMQPVEALRYE